MEFTNPFSQLLPWLWRKPYDTAKEKISTSFEKDYLGMAITLILFEEWKKGDISTRALFSPNSPYYKGYNPSKTSN